MLVVIFLLINIQHKLFFFNVNQVAATKYKLPLSQRESMTNLKPQSPKQIPKPLAVLTKVSLGSTAR